MKETLRAIFTFPRRVTERHPALRALVVPLVVLLSFGITYAVQLITRGGPAETMAWMFSRIGPVLFTMLFLALLMAILWALTNSAFLAALVVTVPAVCLALANFYKVRVNGSPIEPADFKLAKDLGSLMDLAEGNLAVPLRAWAAICGCVLMLAVTLWVSRAVRARRAGVRAVCAVCAAVCLWGGFFSPLARRFTFETFDIHLQSRIGQAYSNEVNGLLAGLFRSWTLRGGEKPDGYGEAYMADLLHGIEESADAAALDDDPPSVILVLSESFFDLTDLPGVTCSSDPLKNFHALESESVSGTFCTSYCGYGTGNIERGVLTGLHSRYFPYGVNVCYMDDADTAALPALPGVFKANGYRTLALHTFTPALYNRQQAFPILGFDEVLFQSDVLDWSRFRGPYLSDDYFADVLISRYEEMTADGSKAFLFGISMENHQPYPADKFPALTVHAESAALTPDENAMLTTIAQGITYADESLGKLTDYFSQVDEKVLVVFFGDHRPSTPTGDGESLYVKLGLCENADDFYWSPEERAELYSTDYLVWANYDAFDEAQKSENVLSGDTILGNQILNYAGVRKPLYWYFLDTLNAQVASYTEQGFVGADGTVSGRPAEGKYPAIDTMRAILYDTFYGEGYITAALNTLR